MFKDTVAGKPNFKIDVMVPGKVFDGMSLPIISYTIKGFLWYQGKSNLIVHDTTSFVAKTRLLLDCWGGLWNDKDLSFYFVLMAPHYHSKRLKD